MNLTRPPPIPLAALKLRRPSCSAAMATVAVAASKDNSDVAATFIVVVVIIDQLMD